MELSNRNGEGERHHELFVVTLLVWEQLGNCLGSRVCKREREGTKRRKHQGVLRLQVEGDAQPFLFVLEPYSGVCWRFQIGRWTIGL